MASKPEIIDALKVYGVQADPSLPAPTLAKMLREAQASGAKGSDAGDNSNGGTDGATPPPVEKPKEVIGGDGEVYMKKTDVAALIQEALRAEKDEASAHLRVKKVKEHHAHVWRFDGKWVVNFKDRNTDPYSKEKVYAWQKFNEQTRLFEPWITLIFSDGSEKDIPLVTYVRARMLIWCVIVEKKRLDTSYSIGEVEKKKDDGDKLVGTGIYIDQEVTRYEDVIIVKTPDGATLEIPEYAIA